ncbi:hypothetical protein MPTK1_6g04200 [Marchantia polymorpha subsp. ruderalis]|uniref:Thioredoxin domain-containing protein n=2 Tax=Marchantia polymorpha TaxID=3197 RepID=A0AAF6BND9_MARPO|nr:hypothetical protein MARPO_0745s0001 [Marchantia polymorpha]BBN13523.1 hypothetical protein Mp_6g04200 [Marchantia polymorpha subsp. ruderalis]|eukprot:PTQ26642.1 hypothetical protein MARPO_0745s0001 [Marchantia polymorpha]
MAQCQAQTKKISSSRFDLYGDIFSGHLYGTSGPNGNLDRLQRYSSDFSERRLSNRDIAPNGGFRDEVLKASRKVEAHAPNPTPAAAPADYGHSNGANSDANVRECRCSDRAAAAGHHAIPDAAAAAMAAPGVVKAVSTKSPSSAAQAPKEINNYPATPSTPSSGRHNNLKHSGEVATPPSSGRSNKNSGEMSTPPPPPPASSGRNKNSGEQTTPPPSGGRHHIRAHSGEQPSDKSMKPVDPGFAYGEILKGVGNLNSCDDSVVPNGKSSGDSGSSGRGRAESPKSCSSSSGGSSSGGSPTVGRIVNFGNILPSGGSLKVGNSSPVSQPRSNGMMGQSRRSNSADFPSGNLKKLHAANSSSSNGGNGVYTGGLNAKGSMSNTTSPTGSVGTVNPSQPLPSSSSNNDSSANGKAELIKNAIASMDAEELKNTGNEQYKKGHFSEALSLYDKAIALAPEKAPYRSNRAAALTGLGRLPEALHECLHAIRLDSAYTRAHHRLACLYLRLGQIDSARRYFKTAGPQADWEDTQRMMVIEKHLLRCIQARKNHDWNVLVRETDAAIIAGADSAPQILAYKAEALLKLHRPDEADEVFANVRKVEEVLKRQSFAAINIVVLIIQAQMDMAMGRFEAAVLAAERASHYAPNDFEVAAVKKRARAVAAARKLGNDLFKAGRFSEATTAYGEGLEADVENAVLLCNRAACRAKLGQWEKAVEDCNAALDVHPTYIKALLRRAQCFFNLERLDDAFRDYEVLRREMPGDVEVRRGLFDVQVALKKSKGEDVFKMRFGGDVENVTSNEQFQEAITSPGVSIVEFSTRWSQRCKNIAPCVDNLCKRYLSLNFLKVDVDDLPYLAKLENVNFVPTFKVYKNGSKVLELCGPNEQALERAVIHYSL